MNLKSTFYTTVFAIFIIGCISNDIQAQQTTLDRLGEARIRVAEPGQVADSVYVWGDFGRQAKFHVPRGTTLPEMISYAQGMATRVGGSGQAGDVQFDWSDQRLEIAISRFNEDEGYEEVVNFEYRYNEPMPEDFRNFTMQSQDLLTVQIRRRPSYREYIQFAANTLSAIATTYFIIDSLLD